LLIATARRTTANGIAKKKRNPGSSDRSSPPTGRTEPSRRAGHRLGADMAIRRVWTSVRRPRAPVSARWREQGSLAPDWIAQGCHAVLRPDPGHPEAASTSAPYSRGLARATMAASTIERTPVILAATRDIPRRTTVGQAAHDRTPECASLSITPVRAWPSRLRYQVDPATRGRGSVRGRGAWSAAMSKPLPGRCAHALPPERNRRLARGQQSAGSNGWRGKQCEHDRRRPEQH
jgi:hypothetical protein